VISNATVNLNGSGTCAWTIWANHDLWSGKGYIPGPSDELYSGHIEAFLMSIPLFVKMVPLFIYRVPFYALPSTFEISMRPPYVLMGSILF